MKRALEVIETMSVYTVDGEIKDLTEHIYIIALGVCSYNKEYRQNARDTIAKFIKYFRNKRYNYFYYNGGKK